MEWDLDDMGWNKDTPLFGSNNSYLIESQYCKSPLRLMLQAY